MFKQLWQLISAQKMQAVGQMLLDNLAVSLRDGERNDIGSPLNAMLARWQEPFNRIADRLCRQKNLLDYRAGI